MSAPNLSQTAVVEMLQERTGISNSWFAQARYGLFLHWGLYSILGRGEWARNREQIPDLDYHKLSDQFVADQFDAREWASLAAKWGMRYATLTTKHHDGFCLWNSSVCPFNSVNSAARRDLVKEFVEAFREQGLRVGLYYSLGDWENPDWGRAVHGDEVALERFVIYTKRLVTELLSNYGKIDILWFDLPQGLTAEQWDAEEILELARELQPGIIVNNRLMIPADFSVAEQNLHEARMGRMWEACVTLNESWAYVDGDIDFKTPRAVAKSIAKVASTGGNLLINVGPDATGRLPSASQEILDVVGAWIERNREAVYATSTVRLPFNLWGATLATDRVMYLFLERYPGSELAIGGLIPNVLGASLNGSNHGLSWRRAGEQTIITGLPSTSPDPILSVLRLELDGIPDQTISRVIGGADIMASFPD